jgi:hypothetical protein
LVYLQQQGIAGGMFQSQANSARICDQKIVSHNLNLVPNRLGHSGVAIPIKHKEKAHVLDVNVDYVGRDGVKDMQEITSRLVTNINLPLMIDSTDADKMESGLKSAGGKCIFVTSLEVISCISFTPSLPT